MQTYFLLPVFVRGKSCFDTEEVQAGVSVTFTFFKVCTGPTGIGGKQVADACFFKPHVFEGIKGLRSERKNKIQIKHSTKHKSEIE